jgi:hypothetical protein
VDSTRGSAERWRSSGGRVEELTRAIAIDTSSGLYTYISSLNYS